MKRLYPYIILLSAQFFVLQVWAISAVDDSLLLRNQKNCTEIFTEQKDFSQQILQKSFVYKAPVDKNTVFADSLFNLCRIYFETKQDSFMDLYHKALPIVERSGNLENYFRMRGWLINWLMKKGSWDKIPSDIKLMRLAAQNKNYLDGVDMADQLFAMYYGKIGLKDASYSEFVNLLDRMEKRDAPRDRRIYVLLQLLVQSEEPKQMKQSLVRLKSYINYLEVNHLSTYGEKNTLDFLRFMYFRRNAYLHYKEENVSALKDDVDMLDNLIDKNNSQSNQRNLKFAHLLYFYLSKQYDKALPIADSLMDYYRNVHSLPDLLTVWEKKCSILRATGHSAEAFEQLVLFKNLKDSLSEEKYYKDLAILRSQLDFNQLEIDNKKMEVDTARQQTRIIRLEWGGVSLGLLIFILLFFFYKRRKDSKRSESEAQQKLAFLANMNHEIRTPLNAIDGFSQLLVDETDPEEQKNFSEIIRNNNELLQRLINDVLDISKIQSSKMTLNEEMCDLSVLMNELYQTMNLRIPENVTLELVDCKPCSYLTDRNRLTQIMTNLITNAIKHTHSGSIRIGYTESGNYYRFFVADTGEGIPADKIDSIFSRYVQLNDWTSGVGLGLAICQGLVQQMKGTIHVKSELGKGSEFYFVLPKIKS